MPRFNQGQIFLSLYRTPHNTIKKFVEEFKKLCKTSIDGCIIDPLLKFARPKDFSERDDIYANYIGSICVDFARITNTSFHLVMHQLTPNISKDSKKYPEPSMYRIKKGEAHGLMALIMYSLYGVPIMLLTK